MPWADISQAATAVAVLIAAGALWVQRRQLRSNFEQKYVDRYWKIDEARLRAAIDLSNPRRQLEIRLQDASYARLCEDEYEMRRLGSVSGSTWRVWHSAIVEQGVVVLEVLADVEFQELSDLRLHYVKCCLEHLDGHDPGKCPAIEGSEWWRRWSGRTKDASPDAGVGS